MAAVSIDAIEYVETVTIETPSPIDGTTIATVMPSDFVRVTLSVGELVGHWLYFKPEAIADRMRGYGLADEQQAIEALVRELVFGWSPELLPADPSSTIDVLGGVDERIAIAWDKAAAHDADKFIKGDHGVRIAEHAARLEAEAQPGEPLLEPELASPPDEPVS